MSNNIKYFFLIIACFCTIRASAQYLPEKVNKKAAKLYEAALQKATDGYYPAGIQLLQAALAIDTRFADAYLSIGGMFGEQKKYDSAIYYYEKAKAIDSNYFKDYQLPYSINLAGMGLFGKSLAAINQFLTIRPLNTSSLQAASYRKKCYEFALAYQQQLGNNTYTFNPVN
jgi:tetratricopeptide (TPR) repeat protein